MYPISISLYYVRLRPTLLTHFFYLETPTGTVPILEIDGSLMVSQTLPIARYVAREFSEYFPVNHYAKMRFRVI